MTQLATRRDRPVDPAAWAWRSGAHAALDHRFHLAVEPPEVVPGLQRLVAPFRTSESEDPGSCYEVRRLAEERLPVGLFVDGERLCAGRTAADLAPRLTWHLNRSVVARSRRRLVLLHAAAATTAGLTVVLPAEMDCGKTTTLGGLLRRGYDYVTDETVALDPVTGRVSPFPKLLSLDQGSWPLFPDVRRDPRLPPGVQWYVGAVDLGSGTASGPVPPPRVIVFPRFSGAETRLQRLGPAETLAELVRMTFDFPDHAGRNLRALAAVAREATAARLEIGCLDDAVDAIEGLVSDRLLEVL